MRLSGYSRWGWLMCWVLATVLGRPGAEEGGPPPNVAGEAGAEAGPAPAGPEAPAEGQAPPPQAPALSPAPKEAQAPPAPSPAPAEEAQAPPAPAGVEGEEIPEATRPPEGLPFYPLKRPEVTVAQLDEMFEKEGLQFFGYDFFAQAGEFVPPANIPPPATYRLGPGDQLEIRFWSDIRPEAKEVVTVNEEGQIYLPVVGPLGVQGLTMAQFEERVKKELSAYYRGIQVHVALTKLRSIQVNIVGEATRPGTYTMNALATAFNALYTARGPNARGSMRRIRLIRNTREVATIDLYDFLMRGRTDQDLPLESGDTLFIPLRGDSVSILGAVLRPAHYELKGGERLWDAIEMSGGIRPPQQLQVIHVDRLEGHERRVLLDVDATDLSPESASNVPLRGNDRIAVLQVPQERRGLVTVGGPLAHPGQYSLRPGMRVSDLVEAAGGIKPGERIFWDRADLFRLRPDGSVEIQAVDLKAALARAPEADLELREWDRLVVYSYEEKAGRHLVTVRGQVAQPGAYELSAGMRVSDLLSLAKGVLPDAYPDRLELVRTGPDEVKQILYLNLKAVNANDPQHNVALQDRDALHVYSWEQAEFRRPTVTISGPVQRPATYELRENMTVRDLLFQAGGLLPNKAYLERADLVRVRPDQTEEILRVNLDRARAGDPEHNLLLQHEDQLRVYTWDQVEAREKTVTISGAVQRPGDYPWREGMTVADLLFEAGGPLPNKAYLSRAELTRLRPDQTKELRTLNLHEARQGHPEHNLPLQGGDTLKVYTWEEAQNRLQTVTIAGAVAKPGEYEWRENMTVQDLLFLAGGPLANQAYLERAHLVRMLEDQSREIRPLNLREALDSNPEHNLFLQGGDTLRVYTWDEAEYRLKTVTVRGAVARPGEYELKQNMRVWDLLFEAGGPLPNTAYLPRADLTRSREDQSQEILEIDLRAVQRRDPAHDLELQGGDVLHVYSWKEAQFREETVSIQGAVQRPGDYPWQENMTVRDLIFKAGGLLPNEAFLSRAHLTRVLPDQTKEVKTLHLQRALEKQPADNLLLQGGDVLRVFSWEEAEARTNFVRVVGAVAHPDEYEWKRNMTVRDLLLEAGGPLPNQAFLSQAHLTRLHPDQTKEILPINLQGALEDRPADNLLLQGGDTLRVFFWEEAEARERFVHIDGPVQRPGDYEWKQNMTVRDLLLEAGGPLPNTAFLSRAHLIRELPDQTQALIPVNLQRALEGDAEENRLLQGGDRLLVYSWDTAEHRHKYVRVAGAVARPGEFPLRQNMTVADLLMEAGGPIENQAYLPRADLTRTRSDQTKEVRAINLEKAIAGDPAENVVLQGQDALRVYTWEEAIFALKRVFIGGPVQRPGEFELKQNMTVRDLVFEAGGLLTDRAYPHQADLVRLRPDQTKEILRVDLEAALAGQEEANLRLQGGDELKIYTWEEVQFREATVEVTGAVQKPGTYYRKENMRLSDLLRLAGGLLPEAYHLAEIARPRGVRETAILKVDLQRLLQEGDQTQDVLLQDRDRVSIRAQQEFLRRPAMVALKGEFKLPGHYALKGQRGSLRALIDRAGGLTADAFPEGAVFIRQPELLFTGHQASTARRALQTLGESANVQYQAWLSSLGVGQGTGLAIPPLPVAAQSLSETTGRAGPVAEETRAKLPASTPDSREKDLASPAPSALGQEQTVGRETTSSNGNTDSEVSPVQLMAIGQATSRLAEAVEEEEQAVAVIAPRPLSSAPPSGRIPIDLVSLLAGKDEETDLVVEDGDLLYVPSRPNTVVLAGAVVNPGALLFRTGLRLQDYLDQAGGLTPDADADHLTVVHPNGQVAQIRLRDPLQLGDWIIVPTRPLIYERKKSWSDRAQEVLSGLVNAAALYLLVDRF